MLRLEFGVADLARTNFASPLPLCELAGSVEAIQRPTSAFRTHWWSTRPQLPKGAQPLLRLVSAHGGVPEFLAPESDGSLDELVDQVSRTPAGRIASDLAETLPGSRDPWVMDLAAGRPRAVEGLAGAMRCWHDHVVAPLWPRLQPVVAAELSSRAWQWTLRGADETLNALHRNIRWCDGILEVDAPIEADIRLGGRGLRLVPSAIWSRPVMALGWEQPTLTYPVPSHRWSDKPTRLDERDGLDVLLGSTRSRVLRRLAGANCTTSGLATALGISLASASTHAATLRKAGLVVTLREGRAVRHELTPLGHLLAASASPGREHLLLERLRGP